MSGDKLTISYWAIRGLGAPLRMMAEYAGKDYEVKNYQVTGEPGNYDHTSWFDSKPPLKAKNALMNLPYVVDGDTVISQTNACIAYIGRKCGLMGKDDAQITKVEQILCEVMDLRNKAVGLFYSNPGTFAKNHSGHLDSTVATSYGKFEEWLGQQGTAYTAGDAPTAGDFHLWEMLDQHEILAAAVGADSPLANRPKLAALYKAFRALPELGKYFTGPLYALPINNRMASFGGDRQVSGPLELIYFDGAGRAQLTRLALAVGGVHYKDTRHTFAEWPAVKGDSGSAPAQAFGSMPVIKHGPFILAQSQATAVYAAELGIYQSGCLGSGEEAAKNRATELMVMGAYADVQSLMYKCLFGDEDSKKAGREDLPIKVMPLLKGLERVLDRKTSGGPYFFSEEEPTLADLACYDLVHSPFPGLNALGVDISHICPKFNSVVQAVNKHPAVAAAAF